MLMPKFEIKVIWTSTLEGYVNGLRFNVSCTGVNFPKGFKSHSKKALHRCYVLKEAVKETPEYKIALREAKSFDLKVTPKINEANSYSVYNPLNKKIYTVIKNGDSFNCDCDDHFYRHSHCKHIIAVNKRLGIKEEPILLLPSYGGKLIRTGGRSSQLKSVTSSSIDVTAVEARNSIGL